MGARYTGLDIANFLVYLMSDSCDDLSNMKLNKILYYAQGHYLQRFGEPLFSDKIVAWPHGPVVHSVYTAYKSNGDRPITAYNAEKAASIDDDVKSFLLDVAREYGRYTASALRNMTHKPKAPWSLVPEGSEISVKSIKDYFVSHEPAIAPLELDFTDDDFIGQRDADGLLVLPGDWQDEEV